MGRLKGIEPLNVGTTIRCVNHFGTTRIIEYGEGWITLNKMGRLMGIEPTSCGTTIRCGKHFDTSGLILKFAWISEGPEELNPHRKVWENPGLTVKHAPKNRGGGGQNLKMSYPQGAGLTVPPRFRTTFITPSN